MTALDMAPLRILCAPGHAPDFTPDIVHTAEDTGASVIVWSEAYKVAAWLRNRPAFRAVCAISDVDTRLVASPCGDAGDNPVSVAWGLPIDNRQMVKVDDPGRPLKFAPERWLYEVDVVWQGGVVTVVSVHPSPLFCGLRKWRRVMRAARLAVVRAQRRGHAVVLAGDLQTSGLLVRAMFRGLGLTHWVVGVVWMSWSGLEKVDGTTLQPPGMDHAWMLANFRPAFKVRARA